MDKRSGAYGKNLIFILVLFLFFEHAPCAHINKRVRLRDGNARGIQAWSIADFVVGRGSAAGMKAMH